MTAEDIIHGLGRDKFVADELMLPITTVNGWKRSNFIPMWHRTALLGLALRRGFALSTADFPEKEDAARRAA